MKITSSTLSIPPYVSTTWKNIASLHAQPQGSLYTLIIILQNRVQIEIPDLDKETIEKIFEAHALAEEMQLPKSPFENPFSFSIPVKADKTFDALTTSMQHNPAQANLPPIAPDILRKIGMIARAFGLEDTDTLSKPEPNCNCAYCQMARALQTEEPSSEQIEEVSADDLKFRDWEIAQAGDKLYNVTNPLDLNERYSVFLGTPLGCTCGDKNCEHIRAVLNS